MRITYTLRSRVDDDELSALQATASSQASAAVTLWAARLERHSLTWVQAWRGPELVGFVNVAWDGGLHAFVLDTVVDPGHQRQGIGAELVRRAADEARGAGCHWLHVDYEPHLEPFYLQSCGFRPTAAGLLRLAP